MTTILLTGKTGQVGWELQHALAPLGRLIAFDRTQLDLSNSGAIRKAIRDASPNFVVNAAGFTAVDLAESEPALAMQLNGIAPGIMAEAAKLAGAVLIHFSTSFVFDGTKRKPYLETDQPAPVNTYGRTKLAGERAITACGGKHIILRASWTYSHRRNNFPLTILKLARERLALSVVDDQIGAPTWARAYAEATAELVRMGNDAANHSGIYHLSAAGQASRYQWAKEIIESARSRCRDKGRRWAQVQPIPTAEYPLPAVRPLYTMMDNSKISGVFGIKTPHWRDQLRSFLSELPAPMLAGSAPEMFK
jgi:dTDP-4-dehydrorhamnose reductase